MEPNTKIVNGVQFSIISSEEVRKRSAVEIFNHDTIDKDNAVLNGLFDLRMGVTDMNKICGTCGQNNKDCPGHFGHIELARPVYHYHLINYVVKILKCVCYRCSKLLINKNELLFEEMDNKERWDKIYDLSQKVTRCGQDNGEGCGCMQPDKIKLNGVEGISATWSKLDIQENTQILNIELVNEILERITDEDFQYMGFNPKWFVQNGQYVQHYQYHLHL